MLNCRKKPPPKNDRKKKDDDTSKGGGSAAAKLRGAAAKLRGAMDKNMEDMPTSDKVVDMLSRSSKPTDEAVDPVPLPASKAHKASIVAGAAPTEMNDEEQTKKLLYFESLFFKLDPEGDGTIDFDTARVFLTFTALNRSPDDIEKWMAEADGEGGDGQLDRGEWIELCLAQLWDMPQDSIELGAGNFDQFEAVSTRPRTLGRNESNGRNGRNKCERTPSHASARQSPTRRNSRPNPTFPRPRPALSHPTPNRSALARQAKAARISSKWRRIANDIDRWCRIWVPVWYFTGLFILYCLEFRDDYSEATSDAFTILDGATTSIIAPGGFGSLLIYGVVITVAFTIYLWLITIITKELIPLYQKWRDASFGGAKARISTESKSVSV